MNEVTKTGESKPAETNLPLLELGKWMGRCEAFGQVAGRCSAAEIESLRRIHDGKLYQLLNCTWEEFCAQYLKVTARTVDRELAHHRRFGPAFFIVRQMTRITAREYAAIADCIGEEGVRINGEVIPLDSDHGEQVAGAVKALLEQNGPVDSAPAPATFDSAMQRFRAASEALCSFEEGLDAGQANAIAIELAKLIEAAAGWGVQVRMG